VRAVVADAVQRRACQVRDLAAELAAGPNARSALFNPALYDSNGTFIARPDA